MPQGDRPKVVRRICAKCGVVDFLPQGKISEYCTTCRLALKVVKERENQKAKLAAMPLEERELVLDGIRSRKRESARRSRLKKKTDPDQLVVLADRDPYKRDNCKHYADCRLKAAKKNSLKVCDPGCSLFCAQVDVSCTEEKVWVSSYFEDTLY